MIKWRRPLIRACKFAWLTDSRFDLIFSKMSTRFGSARRIPAKFFLLYALQATTLIESRIASWVPILTYMKIIRKIFIFAPVAVCIWLSGAQLHGQFILYGTDGSQGNPSELYILDKSDGSIGTTVGPIGFAVTGLAIHPTTGVLYGSTSNNDANFPGHLITINKETGQGTIVGDFGFIVAASVGPFGGIATQTMADLTFNPSGVLFGWLENSTDDLFTIELALDLGRPR